MIHSTRAITLVLLSAGSVLAGYHAFSQIGANYDGLSADQDEWANGPTSRPASGYSHYYGHHSGSYWSGSSGVRSGSSAARGTSYGGFGSTAHAVGS